MVPRRFGKFTSATSHVKRGGMPSPFGSLECSNQLARCSVWDLMVMRLIMSNVHRACSGSLRGSSTCIGRYENPPVYRDAIGYYLQAIGSNRVDVGKAMDAVGKAGGANFINGTTLNMVNRSSYGRRLVNNSTRDLPPVRNLGNSSSWCHPHMFVSPRAKFLMRYSRPWREERD